MNGLMNKRSGLCDCVEGLRPWVIALSHLSLIQSSSRAVTKMGVNIELWDAGVLSLEDRQCWRRAWKRDSAEVVEVGRETLLGWLSWKERQCSVG